MRVISDNVQWSFYAVLWAVYGMNVYRNKNDVDTYFRYENKRHAHGCHNDRDMKSNLTVKR